MCWEYYRLTFILLGESAGIGTSCVNRKDNFYSTGSLTTDTVLVFFEKKKKKN